MRPLVLALALLATTAAAQTTHEVTVQNFEFSPATLSIEAGDTVRWINAGGSHNLRQLTGDEAFGRPEIGSGWTYEFTFTEVGTSTYQCDPHQGSMQGSITVTSASSNEEAPESAARLDIASENPFTGSVRFALALPSPQAVRVAVYDARGREVDVLLDGPASGGTTELEWTSGSARPGVYVVRATAPGVSLSQGVLLAGRGGAHVGGH